MNAELDLFAAPKAPPDPKAGSQVSRVLAMCRKPGGITQRDAIEFGCYRLAARVKDLREMGFDIQTKTEAHEGGTHARYFLRAA